MLQIDNCSLQQSDYHQTQYRFRTAVQRSCGIGGRDGLVDADYGRDRAQCRQCTGGDSLGQSGDISG